MTNVNTQKQTKQQSKQPLLSHSTCSASFPNLLGWQDRAGQINKEIYVYVFRYVGNSHTHSDTHINHQGLKKKNKTIKQKNKTKNWQKSKSKHDLFHSFYKLELNVRWTIALSKLFLNMQWAGKSRSCISRFNYLIKSFKCPIFSS